MALNRHAIHVDRHQVAVQAVAQLQAAAQAVAQLQAVARKSPVVILADQLHPADADVV